MIKIRNTKREIRHKRVRAKIRGTKSKPRLSVYRSSKHIFLQLIDDENGKTLVGMSDNNLKKSGKLKKSERAYEIGKSLAEAALKKGIKRAVFDRGGYKYHGGVKRVAEGAREGGLQF